MVSNQIMIRTYFPLVFKVLCFPKVRAFQYSSSTVVLFCSMSREKWCMPSKLPLIHCTYIRMYILVIHLRTYVCTYIEQYIFVLDHLFRSPFLSTSEMDERMEGRKMIKLHRIASKVKDGDIEGNWVTIGVIIEKLPPKDSVKVSLYL